MIPNYLYHYTSLEVLILILKEGKIRFKRLDKVNDPTEGNIPEFPELCIFLRFRTLSPAENGHSVLSYPDTQSR